MVVDARKAIVPGTVCHDGAVRERTNKGHEDDEQARLVVRRKRVTKR